MAEAPATAAQPCPHCGKTAAWEGNPWRPFCSERCRIADLGNWASGAYRIPGAPLAREADEERGANAGPDDEPEETT